MIRSLSRPWNVSNESAKLGGQPVEVPDIRRKPFTGTEFWNHIPFPEDEPEVCKYHPAELDSLTQHENSLVLRGQTYAIPASNFR